MQINNGSLDLPEAVARYRNEHEQGNNTVLARNEKTRSYQLLDPQESTGDPSFHTNNKIIANGMNVRVRSLYEKVVKEGNRLNDDESLLLNNISYWASDNNEADLWNAAVEVNTLLPREDKGSILLTDAELKSLNELQNSPHINQNLSGRVNRVIENHQLTKITLLKRKLETGNQLTDQETAFLFNSAKEEVLRPACDSVIKSVFGYK